MLWVYFMAAVAANYADMSAEVVEFKNIGCGQYLVCCHSEIDFA